MRVLGIDQSFAKSGLVVLDDQAIEFIHAEIFDSRDKSDDPFERTWIIAKRVVRLIEDYNVDKVMIEGLAFGSMGDNTRTLAGLQFTIVNMIRFGDCKLRPTVEIISPQTLKKFATGSGKAKKNEVIEKLPESVQNYFLVDLGIKKTKGLDDLADAWFLAMYGVEKR